MKKNLHVFISGLAFITFIFSGCLAKKEVQIVYPEWYKKTYQDSGINLFATAQAKSEKEAVTLALNEIASKISISVESQYSSRTSMSKDSYSQSATREIKNSVKKIEFTNYQVLNKQKLENNEFIVLVQVRKDLLASSLELKIENDIKKQSDTLSTQYDNLIARLKSYQSVANDIKELEPTIYILKSLDDLSGSEKYLATLNNHRNKITDFQNSIKFKVSGLSAGNGKEFSDQLTAIIVDKGFVIVNSGEDIALSMTINSQKINALGSNILKVTIDIVAKDKSNKIIGQERMIVSGKSISHFEQAYEFAIKDFYTKLTIDNVVQKILGI